MVGIPECVFSPTVLTSDSPADGSTNTRSEPSDVAKNVRMMVSGIVSYTAGLRYQGHQSYVSFHLHVLVRPTRECRDIFALSACHHSH